ncbi:MAG TPA: hypothetical protein VF951_00235 [Streptosporangiaceae bacterium]
MADILRAEHVSRVGHLGAHAAVLAVDRRVLACRSRVGDVPPFAGLAAARSAPATNKDDRLRYEAEILAFIVDAVA